MAHLETTSSIFDLVMLAMGRKELTVNNKPDLQVRQEVRQSRGTYRCNTICRRCINHGVSRLSLRWKVGCCEIGATESLKGASQLEGRDPPDVT